MPKGEERQSGESIREWMERLIAEFAVVIFSKTYCPFCTMAKTEISKASKSVSDFKGPVLIELDTMREGSEVQSALRSMTGRSTVPNVFINGKTVGGGDDVRALARKGKLVSLIGDATRGGPIAA
mmetsp:Transcript_7123/g.21738  ORF Transcript_7123/g.21738 Transcript_7123/m.21738 type:complete len:125 (-) Transcript_7123:1588-1962(-)